MAFSGAACTALLLCCPSLQHCSAFVGLSALLILLLSTNKLGSSAVSCARCSLCLSLVSVRPRVSSFPLPTSAVHRPAQVSFEARASCSRIHFIFCCGPEIHGRSACLPAVALSLKFYPPSSPARVQQNSILASNVVSFPKVPFSHPHLLPALNCISALWPSTLDLLLHQERLIHPGCENPLLALAVWRGL